MLLGSFTVLLAEAGRARATFLLLQAWALLGVRRACGGATAVLFAAALGALVGGLLYWCQSGAQRGSLSGAASYDAPSVSSAGASNVASSGAHECERVWARAGRELAPAPSVVLEEARARASVWRSDSGLVCRTVAGRGRDHVALGVCWSAAGQREWCCELRRAERELCCG